MKNRRGISSVVGTVFAIIALSTTVGYITYSMTVLDQYNQSVIARNQQASDVVKEKFQVGSVTFANNKLNITVTNTGSLPINFTKVWVTNSSSPAAWVYSYVPRNTVVTPGATIKNIGQSLPVYINNANQYHIKMVTSRGNFNEFDINAANSAPVDIRFYAFPPTMPSTFQTTLVMIVTNNMTNKGVMVNVTPAALIDGGGVATPTQLTGPTPARYPTLSPGQSAYFTWNLVLTGNSGDTHTYTASLQNGFPGNTASTTVTVYVVPAAIQSGTSLSSLGLSIASAPITELVLHKETNTSPAGTYQLWNGSPEPGSGTSLYTGTIKNPTYTWITNNDSAIAVNAVQGAWNLSLRYASDKVPNGFPNADLIYHFETLSGGITKESNGNPDDLTTSGGPTLLTGGGANGSNAIPLNGNNQYMSRGVDSRTSVNTQNSATAGWFETTGSVATQKVIFHIGNAGLKPFYDISLNSAGKVVFSYSGFSTGGTVTTCTSASSYNDGNWHHFVAIKYGPDSTQSGQCSLYVDNAAVVSAGASCVLDGNCNNAPPVTYYVGYNGTKTTTYFPGIIDDIIHWNTATLSASLVTTLLKTSYGTNAHKLTITIEKDKADGVTLIQTLKSDSNYPIRFFDPIVEGGAAGTFCKTNCNYTTGTIGPFTFGHINPPDDPFGTRLKLKVTFSSGLNMTIRTDDNTLANPPTTFLQSPNIDNVFPGYLTYTLGTNPSVYVSNAGPSPSWLGPLSRLSFQSVTQGGNSYASLPTAANGTTMAPTVDSTLFKVGQILKLDFTVPNLIPCVVSPGGNACPAGTPIPAGNYRLYTFLNGYDDSGQLFIRTVYIGPVKAQ